jgi:hypothetical protein
VNDENRQDLLAALREQRRQQGRIQGLLVVECPMTSCPVSTITMRVQEQSGANLVQPKITCCRCGTETWFLRLE